MCYIYVATAAGYPPGLVAVACFRVTHTSNRWILVTSQLCPITECNEARANPYQTH
jgi:hypothetical protein